MKFLFIIDPIHRLDPCHDSSVAMMEAAQVLGHEVFITQANLLSVKQGQAWAILQQVQLVPINLVNRRWITVDNWFTLGEKILTPVETVDAVFMRTDPPVNDAYLYATYILDYVDQNKTLVINAPQGIRAANEKMYALQFTQCVPETIVSANKQVIKDFVEAKQETILKPLGNKAGEGILFLQAGDRNFNSIIELSTHQEQIPVMVQTYLHQAKEGDKRIILLNGKPIGALNRLASSSDFRNNMATGGTVAQTSITAREKEICRYLAPKLEQDGLMFVGIDVIGGYLTEVNVTSPTGIREIDRLDGTKLGQDVIKWVVEKIDH